MGSAFCIHNSDDFPSKSQMSVDNRNSQEPWSGCAMKMNLVDNCSKSRLILIILQHYFLTEGVDPSECKCPLYTCREACPDAASLIKHLKACDRFKEGKILCPSCNRIEQFTVVDKAHCSWKKANLLSQWQKVGHGLRKMSSSITGRCSRSKLGSISRRSAHGLDQHDCEMTRPPLSPPSLPSPPYAKGSSTFELRNSCSAELPVPSYTHELPASSYTHELLVPSYRPELPGSLFTPELPELCTPNVGPATCKESTPQHGNWSSADLDSDPPQLYPSNVPRHVPNTAIIPPRPAQESQVTLSSPSHVQSQSQRSPWGTWNLHDFPIQNATHSAHEFPSSINTVDPTRQAPSTISSLSTMSEHTNVSSKLNISKQTNLPDVQARINGRVPRGPLFAVDQGFAASPESLDFSNQMTFPTLPQSVIQRPLEKTQPRNLSAGLPQDDVNCVISPESSLPSQAAAPSRSIDLDEWWISPSLPHWKAFQEDENDVMALPTPVRPKHPQTRQSSGDSSSTLVDSSTTRSDSTDSHEDELMAIFRPMPEIRPLKPLSSSPGHSMLLGMNQDMGKCPAPDCAYFSTEKGDPRKNLAKHWNRKHRSGSRRHLCSCGASYSRFDNLQRHQRLKHPNLVISSNMKRRGEEFDATDSGMIVTKRPRLNTRGRVGLELEAALIPFAGRSQERNSTSRLS
ncbi:uncharacterized protein BCR38DRAFT_405145 [Pseudomassariella vexata]|uniref:Uncharacterized protein n=1 Tax=Pseudomassariella vexata TaxID=1141098 RepID=A0A1Y2ELK0_9PEZI|nr:uncharacterized protein BCR38DRAFT_405145 [Pseudomassariella vexata]ORY72146.1 hypothetical protein BCR38DRAFT_405145 [Pseudomassariella vexata]